MMTARQLAEALLSMPNPDAPVVFWNPGEYWLPEAPVQNPAYVMVEKNMIDRSELPTAKEAL